MSWVLFFDGDCVFCSASVRRVARWDTRGRVFFAPLQGELAREHGLSGHATELGGTMVLLRESDGLILTRSEALLELANALGGRWKLLRIAKLVPRPLRDAVYGWVANKRHRFPGNADICRMPDAALTSRLRE